MTGTSSNVNDRYDKHHDPVRILSPYSYHEKEINEKSNGVTSSSNHHHHQQQQKQQHQQCQLSFPPVYSESAFDWHRNVVHYHRDLLRDPVERFLPSLDLHSSDENENEIVNNEDYDDDNGIKNDCNNNNNNNSYDDGINSKINDSTMNRNQNIRRKLKRQRKKLCKDILAHQNISSISADSFLLRRQVQRVKRLSGNLGGDDVIVGRDEGVDVNANVSGTTVDDLRLEIDRWKDVVNSRRSSGNDSGKNDKGDDNDKDDDDNNDGGVNKNSRKINDTSTTTKNHLGEALMKTLPNGTGIRPIDASLRHPSINNNNSTNNDEGIVPPIVLEISGSSETGKTNLLLNLAVRYAADTSSTIPLGDLEYDIGDTILTSTTQTSSSSSPSIIIIDPERSIFPERLLAMVRVAVLSRFGKVEELRNDIFVKQQQCQKQQKQRQKKEQQQQQQQQQQGKKRKQLWRNDHEKNSDSDNNDKYNDNYNDDSNNNNNDNKSWGWRNVEIEILRLLGRIHIIHPNDTANGCVATFEAIRRALDKRREDDKHILDELKKNSDDDDDEVAEDEDYNNDKNSGGAPPMILFDEAGTAFGNLDRRLESLPDPNFGREGTGVGVSGGTGGGLSGRNELLRQIQRLRDTHKVTIVLSTRVGVQGGPSSSSGGGREWWGGGIVTHRLTCLRRYDDADGWGFEGIVRDNAKEGLLSGVVLQNIVVPFSVTDDGVVS